jgi:transposase
MALVKVTGRGYSCKALKNFFSQSFKSSYREMLALQLERLQLIDTQIATLKGMIAQAMKPHQEAVMRLAEVPGLGVDSAQQIIAEVGVQASTFPSRRRS